MEITKVLARIQLDARDGHIHAFTDEVPGVNICGTDRDTVLRDTIGAIKFYFQEVRGMEVHVAKEKKPNPLLPPVSVKDFQDVVLELSE
jgi:hypothetical protein